MSIASSRGRALVVGSGFGGLAVALRLRALGHEVVVLERLDQPGGRARTFCRGGYRFDAGPTVITAPFLFDELFDLFDRRLDDYVELVSVEPWYRFEFADGTRLDYGADLQETLAGIERFEPADRQGYLRLLEASERIFRVGFEQLADQPFDHPLSMLRQLPNLIRLGSHRSVWQFTRRYLRDDRLRRAFSIQPLLVGGNPFDTTCIYSLIHYLERRWGVHFAMGGTGALVSALTRLLTEQRGELRLNAEVARIDVRGGRAAGVTLTSGESLPADLVVFNGDPAYAYGNLLEQAPKRRWTPRRLGRFDYSMGLYVLYFGTNRRYPDVRHHTIVFGNGYRELLDQIFTGGELSEDLSLYLHRPTATDPSLAPAGHDAFYVLAPVPNLKYLGDWDEHRETLRRRVLGILERRLLPDLSQHIDMAFDMTPQEFHRDYRSTWGAGFSIAPLFRQSAYFRFHNRSEEVEDLYFVGAGTHPGAGVPGVLSSAKVVENLLQSAGA
jgi:phytoene desaturase